MSAKNAEKWLRYASEDLRLSKYAMKAEPPFLKGSSFHAQQCAEKAIKAYLVLKKVRVSKTHDLRALSEAVQKVEGKAVKALEGAEKLTKFITAARYPSDLEITVESVLEAIKISEKIYKAMELEINSK